MRLLLASTAAALLAASAVPVAAAPVSTTRVARVTFTLAPSPGLSFEVELSASSDDRLDVGVMRCEDGACGSWAYYAGPVPQGSVQVDGAAASGKVDVKVAGLQVLAAWRPQAPGTVIVSGAHGGGTGDDTTFTAYRVDPADVTLSVDGATCHGRGGVGDEVFVQLPEGAAGDQLPLQRLRLPSAKPVCSG